MASSRRVGTNENIRTYGNGTRGYTSLPVWEGDTDYDLVFNTISEILEGYADFRVFKDRLSLFGANTSNLYFRIFRAAPGQKHDGTSNTGVKFTWDAADTFVISENNGQVQDICAQSTDNSGSPTAAFWNDNRTNVHFIGCIAYDCRNSGPGKGGGFFTDYYSFSGKTTFMVNCIAHDCEDFGFNLSTENNDTYLYNCTAANSLKGFETVIGTPVTKNCLGKGNSTADFDGTFDASSTNNASSDDTAPGSNPRINRNFVFVDEERRNYHLGEGDTGALFFGVNTTSDPSFPFDDDIDGSTISIQSIGAHSPVIPLASIVDETFQSIRRKVYNLPSVDISTLGYDIPIDIGSDNGIIKYLRLSYPGDTGVDFHLGNESGARDTYNKVYPVTSMTKIFRDNAVNSSYISDELEAAIYFQAENTGATNPTGEIMLEIGTGL